MALEEYINHAWYKISGIDSQLSLFLDPISMEPMSDPVTCEDGLTYNRSTIEKWMNNKANIRADNKVTSPITGTPMGRTVRPNTAVRKQLEEHAEKIVAQMGGKWEVVEAGENKTGKSSDVTQPPTAVVSIQALSKAFVKLDPLRDILMSTLDGWQCPEIVVIGPEKGGKSSVLERLAMVPIFPRDEDICTRMAIRLRLRRCAPNTAGAVLRVMNVETNETIGEPKHIPIEKAYKYVAEAMDAVIASESGSHFSVDHTVVLDVHHPTVPNLDLIDMPGLKTVPYEDKLATYAVLENHITKRGKHSLYLAVSQAGPRMRPNTNLGLQFITEHNLQDKAIGVFTFCDDLHKKPHFQTLAQHLQAPSATVEGGWTTVVDGHVALAKYGWVATMNEDVTEGAATNYQRLTKLAQNELEFFNSAGISTVLEATGVKDRVTCGALVDKLHNMYLEYLTDSWASATFEKIRNEMREQEYKDALLGRSQPASSIGNAAFHEASRLLNIHFPGILDQYFSTVVHPLIRLLQHAHGIGEAQEGEEELPVCKTITMQNDDWSNMGSWCNRSMESMKSVIKNYDLRHKTKAFWQSRMDVMLRAETVVEVSSDSKTGEVSLVRQFGKLFTGRIKSWTGGKKAAMKEIFAEPPFQLCRYPRYVSAIVDCIVTSFDEMCEELVLGLDRLVELLFEPESPWIARMGAGDSQMSGYFDSAEFSGAVLYSVFTKVPSQSAIVELVKKVPFQNETEKCAPARAVITKKRTLLIHAFKGICEALGELAPEGWEAEVAGWEVDLDLVLSNGGLELID